MAYTTIVAGTTITAAWANASVRDQSVSPFADASARTSAVSAPVNGMISVLTSTDRLDIYNGSSWSAIVNPVSGAWLSYTPTLTQSATVTKTVNYAKYIQTARGVYGNVQMTVTGAGTASNGIIVGLPVASQVVMGAVLGSAVVFDSSAGFLFGCALSQVSTVTCNFILGNGTAAAGLGGTGSGMTAGLASPDQVNFSFHYELGADS